jgi:uncharacterized damage-inducible protein DinB
MAQTGYAIPVEQALRFFNKTTSVLTEDDAEFAPDLAQFTVAQHVAHVAQTITWFMSGGFGTDGFDLDFAKHEAEVRKVTSLAEARTWLARAVADCVALLHEQTAETMLAPLPDGPVMGGEPRAAIVGAIVEHTAHHRGALSVYARLRGKVPPMPYGD